MNFNQQLNFGSRTTITTWNLIDSTALLLCFHLERS